jgi:predicted CoA-binding protein
MTSRALVDGFLAEKKLALAGASRSGKKFGNAILKELRAKGYEVIPVHPEAESLEGVACVRSLADLPPGVGGLILCVRPAETEKLVREAAAAGIPRVWMQYGSVSKNAAAFCEEKGIRAIHGECILMFAEPAAGIHRFHRAIWRLFGRLPR